MKSINNDFNGKNTSDEPSGVRVMIVNVNQIHSLQLFRLTCVRVDTEGWDRLFTNNLLFIQTHKMFRTIIVY